jgi:16S rRNA (cytosine1402-N4)-methyltransferase
VNQELLELETWLNEVPDCMANEGRVVVISFHSLEDRLVKQTFKEWKSRKWGRAITKRPIRASERELGENSRSRSAALRAFEWQRSS